MANGGPLFAGTSESDQLDRIFRHLGTPHEGVYPGIVELPEFQKVKVRRAVAGLVGWVYGMGVYVCICVCVPRFALFPPC